MTKIIQKTLMTAGVAVACAGLLTQPIAAVMTPAERVASAYTEVFEINAVYPSADYVMAHYYGLGDTTKTKSVNIFWTDYSTIPEEEADATFASYGMTTPEWANGFYNKNSELSPNTEESASWYLARYRNTNTEAALVDAPGVIYYTVKLANGEMLSQKVDYRSCLDSEYFVADGGACKLERADNGELYYWPYKTGIRLGPDDEPRCGEEEDDSGEDDVDGEDWDGEEDGLSEEDVEGGEDAEITEEDKDKDGDENNDSGDVDGEKDSEHEEDLVNYDEVSEVKIKAPETGAPKNDGGVAISTNWWWLIIPSAVMVGLLIWWFILPVNNKKRLK